MVGSWDWVEESRKEWRHSNGKPEHWETVHSALQIACLQRIADALESIAKWREFLDPAQAAKRMEEKAKLKRLKGEQVKHKAEWAKSACYRETVFTSLTAAVTALVGPRNGQSFIYEDVKTLIGRINPAQPANDWEENFQHDEAAWQKWQDECLAAIAAATLPTYVAKQGTKKQARYEAWLAERKLSESS